MHENDKQPRRTNDFKKSLFLAASLLICPGDDIAVIIAQLNTGLHPDMPVAARIEQVAQVIPLFDINNLKG